MRRVLGSNLSPELQREALSRFIYRSTITSNMSGNKYPRFSDDNDWLAHTLFWVTNKNTLAKRAACESHPTWPNNPELRTR